MSRVSDLVQDAELQTRFHPNYTVHIYNETGPTVHQRAIVREEHWKRQKVVGNGAYGNVWLEQCQKGQREVALRAVKEVVKFPHDSRQIDYYRELEAISKFSHRKYERCFVKSFGWYQNDNFVYIAMEYVEHGDLQRYLHSALPLPESDAQQITFQVLEGLQFMHGNGYSHRDLKPGNILVKCKPPDPWWVKLSDFGISKRVTDNPWGLSTTKGTLAYMAPELLGFISSSKRSDSRNTQAADMWALGGIAFQMLTKKPTFRDVGLLSTYVQSPDRFPSALLRAHDVSEVGIDFITSIMQPNPEDRQTTAGALLEPWMEPYHSHAIKESSAVATEPIAFETMPTSPLEEPLFTPTGRWSTVSMAAPRLQSSTSITSTPPTSFSFSETNTNALESVNEGTIRRVPSANQARYFILRSTNEINIETSAAHGIWCCGQRTNKRLSNAYNSTSGPIFLIFSVNQSRKFCGVAQMKSAWDSSVTNVHWEDGTWEGGFLVEWLSWSSVEFDEVRYLTHKEDNGVSITKGRIVFEICASTGMEMMQRFGIVELVPLQTQQSSDLSVVGSLGVGRLGLATTTGRNGSNAYESVLGLGHTRPHDRQDIMISGMNASKRPLEMDIDDPEGDKRQRT